MMATKGDNPFSNMLKQPWLVATAVSLLLACIFFLSVPLSDEDSAVEEALLSGQRIEFSLGSGEVHGGMKHTPPKTTAESEPSEVIEGDVSEEVAQQEQPAEVLEEISEAMPHEESAAEEGVDGDAAQEEGVAENQLSGSNEIAIEDVSEDGNAAPFAEEASDGVNEQIVELTAEEEELSRKAMEARREKIQLEGGKAPIVIVMTGLGLSSSTTELALEIPVNFTLGFSPYAPDVGTWTKKALLLGFDVLLHLPLETPDYSVDDPGPYALVSTASGDGNVSRLEMLLSLGTGYKGVYTMPNENFSTDLNHMRPVVTALAAREMPLIYGRGHGNVSLLQFSENLGITMLNNDVVIDEEITYEAIIKRLKKLEDIAEKNKYAVGIASPYPLTLKALNYWLKKIEQEERDIQVVPVSVLLEKFNKKVR